MPKLILLLTLATAALCSEVVCGSTGNVSKDLTVVGLPQLNNGWWLNESDSREVQQYWGGLESWNENPPGGLIYKATRDLNGDGINEVILRWTVVGSTWDVYREGARSNGASS